jgi:hypothetical protein
VVFSLYFDSYNLTVLSSFTTVLSSQWLLGSQCSNLVALFSGGSLLVPLGRLLLSHVESLL